jgi:hypothetical protein
MTLEFLSSNSSRCHEAFPIEGTYFFMKMPSIFLLAAAFVQEHVLSPHVQAIWKAAELLLPVYVSSRRRC